MATASLRNFERAGIVAHNHKKTRSNLQPSWLKFAVLLVASSQHQLLLGQLCHLAGSIHVVAHNENGGSPFTPRPAPGLVPQSRSGVGMQGQAQQDLTATVPKQLHKCCRVSLDAWQQHFACLVATANMSTAPEPLPQRCRTVHSTL
eukprot:CAMPEP_0113687814 /NCGR_PEP_ID=MMETSP0038_2-20120614/16162_1 /TAXON_ID=2898 /ORGANISM="Cryptomonas paramecium" /LENGTH=146 /DNA_ID=CAMNT_0000608505 /DNA_START=338 /DNA_END=778 /DNA_ORIENTATION=+ /assembly_acc=CAM_ASM_000170